MSLPDESTVAGFNNVCKEKSLNPYYEQEARVVSELCCFLQALVNFRHWGSSSNDIISPLFIDVFNAFHALPPDSDFKKYFSIPDTFPLSKEKNYQGEKKCKEYKSIIRYMKMKSMLGEVLGESYTLLDLLNQSKQENGETKKEEPNENCCGSEEKEPSTQEPTQPESEQTNVPLDQSQNVEL